MTALCVHGGFLLVWRFCPWCSFFLFSFLAGWLYPRPNEHKAHTHTHTHIQREKEIDREKYTTRPNPAGAGWPSCRSWNDGPVSAPFRQGPKGKWIKGKDKIKKKRGEEEEANTVHPFRTWLLIPCTQEDRAESLTLIFIKKLGEIWKESPTEIWL